MTAAAERAAAGRAARSVARRSAHAVWAPPADRQDPVAVIEAEDARRVAELMPVRRAASATAAGGWSKASGCCRPRATSSSAGASPSASTGATATSTCASFRERKGSVEVGKLTPADQTERDHAALCDAIASGRLEAVAEV